MLGKMLMRFLLSALMVCALTSSASVETQPQRAVSPDDRLELSQIWPDGSLVLRERKSGTVVGRFQFLSPSGGKFPADEVFWSPKARRFVLQVMDLRGPFMRIYTIEDAGVVEVSYPSLHDIKLPARRPKPKEGPAEFPSGGTHFVRWIDDREFVLRYRLNGGIAWDYSITFRVNAANRAEPVSIKDHLADRP